jgi:hypothetical protein
VEDHGRHSRTRRVGGKSIASPATPRQGRRTGLGLVSASHVPKDRQRLSELRARNIAVCAIRRVSRGGYPN